MDRSLTVAAVTEWSSSAGLFLNPASISVKVARVERVAARTLTAGATGIVGLHAFMNGTLTAGGRATVRIYWGTTAGVWAHTNDFGDRAKFVQAWFSP